MANYDSLKATVNANIKANNNQEITGPILNSVLTQMINALGDGYQFMGVATPATNPGTPDAKVFYICGEAGAYPFFGDLRVAESEVAIFRYDSAWHKDPANIASASASGMQEITFNVAAGQTHSSRLDRVYVNVDQGDEFTVEYNTESTYNYAISIFAYYADGTNSRIGNVSYGDTVTFTAAKKIMMLGVYIENAPGAGYVSLIVMYGYMLKAIANENLINSIKAGMLVIRNSLNGAFNTIAHYPSEKKVAISDKGARVYLLGKQITLMGPFDMTYTADSVGAWVLDRSVVENVADGGTIILSSQNTHFANENSASIKHDLILFPVYYGGLAYSGIFGEILLNDDLTSAINRVTSYTGEAFVDAMNSVTGTVTIDRSARTVTIRKEGIRIVMKNTWCQLTGDSDFVMSFDDAAHGNGAWFLRQRAIDAAGRGGTIELSSANIYWSPVSAAGFASGDVLLFACYYGYVPGVGALGPYVSSKISADDMRANAFNSAYNDTDITDKCKQFSALINRSGIAETFIFMTDPHLLGGSNVFDEAQFKNYIGLLQKYYNMLPVDWMICGGDWLNNRDYQDAACWKLGYMDATMRKLFKHYYPVLGNHDTNYQGVVSASDASRGDLTHQTLINLMFRSNKNTYYEWSGNNTRFFVFDTQTDWESSMDAFKWTQINWFAESLLTNRDSHIIVLQHIYYTDGTSIAPMSTNIQAICGAFNRRTSVTLNGVTYDFSGVTGKIHCIIAGHSHFDAIDTAGNVPVWLTTNMRDGNTPTFDLMLVDYTAGKLKSIRVGTGSDREMTLA